MTSDTRAPSVFETMESNSFAPGKAAQPCCCSGQCVDSEAACVPISPPFRVKRLSTSDSGCGSTLGPISEHHGEECQKDVCNASSIGRAPSPLQNTCVGPFNCGDVAARVRFLHPSQREEMEVLVNRSGCHYSKSACLEMRNSRSCPCYVREEQTARRNFGRRRTVSESCTGLMAEQSDAVFSSGRYQGPQCGHSKKMGFDAENPVVKDRPGLCRQHRFIVVLVVIFLSLIAGTVISVYFVNNSEMRRMKNEIILLKESVNAQISPSLAKFSSRGGEFYPRIHMVLNGGSQIPLDGWNQRVLQWTFYLNEHEGFEYNVTTRCLTALKQGIYFVYSQIYVFRHTSIATTGMQNHTIFHTIFKKPFNYPPNEKPIPIAESALSNCWNEKAHSQIHTSYQGLIVKIQPKDRLFVGLEGYDESSDILNSESTFFGAFKLR